MLTELPDGAGFGSAFGLIGAGPGAADAAGADVAWLCQADMAAADAPPPTRIPIIILLAETRKWFPCQQNGGPVETFNADGPRLQRGTPRSGSP